MTEDPGALQTSRHSDKQAMTSALLAIAQALNRIADAMPVTQEAIVKHLTDELSAASTRLDTAIHSDQKETPP